MKHLAIFIIFSSICINISAQNVDIDLLRSINKVESTKGFSTVISETTDAVGIAIPVIMSSVALLDHDDQLLKDGIYMAATLAVNGLLTQSFKFVVNRQRPSVTYSDIDAYKNYTQYSFPSGHTSMAFSTATALTLKYPKWYVAVPSYAWACSVGYSRMNLGVHYPSDVLAGAALGVGSAYLTYLANQWFWSNHKKRLLPNKVISGL
ncbi:MAG: phosphatase PAP2 family protein [Paludibacter sp.]|jgi:membrane-associated phospholipid phosphatase|nr:phosphatase PAP2 family protein [Paludibacter sp.]